MKSITKCTFDVYRTDVVTEWQTDIITMRGKRQRLIALIRESEDEESDSLFPSNGESSE